MTFHPKHMEAGIKKALASPKTPPHLKPHLQARLNGVKNVGNSSSINPFAMRGGASAPVKKVGAAPVKKPVARVKPNAFFGGF